MWRTALSLLALLCAADSLPLNDFFPFGPGSGDATLVPGALQSTSLSLKQPVPVFGRSRTHVTVSVALYAPLHAVTRRQYTGVRILRVQVWRARSVDI